MSKQVDIANTILDTERRKAIVKRIESTEPNLLGIYSHFLVDCRKEIGCFALCNDSPNGVIFKEMLSSKTLDVIKLEDL